jgi:DNA-binding CsgD family transcriptional regulator
MTRVAIISASAPRRDALRARAAGSGIAIVHTAASLDEIGDIDVDVLLVFGRELFLDAIDRAAENEDVAVVGLVSGAGAVAETQRATSASATQPGLVRGWALLPETATGPELHAAIAAADAGLAAFPVEWAADGDHGRTSDADATPLSFSPDEDAFGTESLTRREQDVLELLSLGLSNRRIAERLGISGHTVKFHVAAIYGKLGVSGRTAAVNRALRRGILKI